MKALSGRTYHLRDACLAGLGELTVMSVIEKVEASESGLVCPVDGERTQAGLT